MYLSLMSLRARPVAPSRTGFRRAITKIREEKGTEIDTKKHLKSNCRY